MFCVSVCLEMLDVHLQNNQRAEDDVLGSPDHLQGATPAQTRPRDMQHQLHLLGVKHISHIHIPTIRDEMLTKRIPRRQLTSASIFLDC